MRFRSVCRDKLLIALNVFTLMLARNATRKWRNWTSRDLSCCACVYGCVCVRVALCGVWNLLVNEISQRLCQRNTYIFSKSAVEQRRETNLPTCLRSLNAMTLIQNYASVCRERERREREERDSKPFVNAMNPWNYSFIEYANVFEWNWNCKWIKRSH